MRYPVALALPIISMLLTGCVSERHFASDSLWPFGNPNAPDNHGENAQRALGAAPNVTPIAPQAGNVWPGAVQPVPTIADIEKNMNQPLGQDYAPSLPSPYPPGQQPVDTDSDDSQNYAMPSGIVSDGTAQGAGSPAAVVPDTIAPNPGAPTTVAPPGTAPGITAPNGPTLIVPANPHARE